MQQRIKDAFNACCRLCESNHYAEQWFVHSFDEAKAGEKQHRRSVGSGYKLSLDDAGRFFAVKWFLDAERHAPSDYAAACGLRPDSLYALGARDLVRADKTKNETWHRLYSEFQDVRELDYVKEFTK